MKCPYCHKEFMSKHAEIRSLPENAYYHSVVVGILSEELGYTTWEMHELLKQIFLGKKLNIIINNNVEEVWIAGSTAKLTIPEFEKFLEDVRIWAATSFTPPIIIPLPSENINVDNNNR